MLKRRYRSARQIDGVIDLERLRSGPSKCLERDPKTFLDLTYPSVDLKAMLQALSRRFSDDRPEGTGLVLAEAVKGLGKSHALLTAYHLFAHPAARGWMKNQGLSWAPPPNPVIIIQKFTDQYLPMDSLWTALDAELGAGWSTSHPPSLDELRKALVGKHLVLILDELERGISNIIDSSRRSQNLSFLQMLSEEANRGIQVTLFCAIYDGTVEPGSTLKRVPRVELRFRNSEDRAAIVRHRLFANSDTYDRSGAEALIRSYGNAWSRLAVKTSDEDLSALRKAFPFLPGLIELVFERIAGTGGFQGTRGALGLLAAMLDASSAGPSQSTVSFLLTAGHCRLTDSACADRLQDLDPAGSLINCAQRNFQDLKGQPYAERLASAVLLASLVPGAKGVTREDLVRHVLGPGDDPNRFESTLQAFRTYGSYFHEREGRFFFDLEENENAKVEVEAIRLGDERAREEVKTIWRQEIFRETQQAVVFADLEGTREALNEMSKQTLRFVLSPRRLSSVERHALYFGSEVRNQIILLEPRDEKANHLNNADILAAAKRSLAASSLAPTAGTAERRNRYERISSDERTNAKNFLRSTGLVYVRVEQWGDRHEDSTFEMESLGQISDKQGVLDYLRRQLYPRPLLVEHLRAQIQSLYGSSVCQVERMYRNTLGYPVPIMVPDVSDAILALAEESQRTVGLQHPRRNYCGERVDLGPGELAEAILAAPWPSATPGPDLGTRAPVPPVVTPEAPDGRPLPGPAQASQEIEERATPSCRTKGELRQELALRLIDVEGQAIQRARFLIFSRYEDTNLADLPSALRGSITRNGSLEVQLDLTIPGPLDKPQMESLTESLPNFEGGTYSASLRVALPQQRAGESPNDGEEP